MRRRRVTVVLNRVDLELFEEEERRVYESEWTHEGDLSSDELGVTITWGTDPYESFIPWTSVLRIDERPCTCMECEKES
jgi:hypothetical protein